MFKILTLAVLLYALYRLFFGPPLLDTPEIKKGSKQELDRDEDAEYVDYEEIE